MNKTGTTSLHAALKALGFPSLHDGGPAVHDSVQRAIDEGVPLLSHVDRRYDAFSDIGLLARRFRLLDVQYPGSRFVLTVRPVDEWVASRCRHVEQNQRRQAVGRYTGDFLRVDEAAWEAEWNRHVDGARRYFRDRSDFVEIDLTADPSWGPICALLSVPQPSRPFPKRNVSRASSRRIGRR